MEKVSNVNRVATANTFAASVDMLMRVAGLVIQSHRAYENSRKRGRGLLQREVAQRARVTKTVVSQLERGCKIPGDAVLRRIFRASGLRLGKGTAGEGFFRLLRAIRIHGPAVRRVAKETPV